VVGRLHVQRQAAEPAERQPVAHRLLGARIGERAPLLQKQDLEHRQRRITRRAGRRAMDRRKQRLERRPVEPLLDPLQKASDFPLAAHHRVHKRRLRQVTARHRRIVLSETAPENQNPLHSAKISDNMLLIIRIQAKLAPCQILPVRMPPLESPGPRPL
jgi:hypothetical protein